MEQHFVKILAIDHLTHDTLRIVTEKPAGYAFEPGQATDIAINKNGWKNEKRPFTFTSLVSDPHLEFIIKTYPEHDGATDKLLHTQIGDELILHEVFGSIRYKGEGVFIAGGAGMTPFLAMLRALEKSGSLGNNSMIYANKTTDDIILREELENRLGNRLVHILSDEKTNDIAHGLITEDFLRQHVSNFNQFFYVCGPMPMMEAVEKHLASLGVSADYIVKEGW